MSKELHRCSGHCCRDFTLPYSPENLQKFYEEERSKYSKYLKMITNSDKKFEEGLKYFRTNQYLVPTMVVFLGTLAVDYNGELMPHDLHHYTCKNLNVETGDCMDYKHRPEMCRNFPDRGSCPYKECTRVVEQPKLEEFICKPIEKEFLDESRKQQF